jgi:hypothetical protein
MKTLLHFLITVLAFSVGITSAFAQGTAFTYEGRLNDGSAPANGVYDLRFLLFDVPTGGSLIAPPITNSNVAITGGLFAVALDFGPAFNGLDRWLQIDVRTNGGGNFIPLLPRQPIMPTPYAIFTARAGTVTNGAIDTAQLANGAVTSLKLASNSITSVQLASAIALGTSNVNGRLDVYRTANGAAAISLIGSAGQISTYGDNAQEATRLQANSYGGRLTTRDEVGNLTTLLGSATNAGGFIQAYQANGNLGVVLDGDSSGASGGGQLRIRNSDGSLALSLSTTNIGQISAYGSDGQPKVQISGSSWGSIYLNNGKPSNDRAVTIASASINGGGYLSLANTNGSSRLTMQGQNTDGGGALFVYDQNGFNTAELNGASSSGNAAQLLLKRSDGTVTMNLSGAESSSTGSQLLLRQANGTKTIELDGEFNAGGGGFLRLYKGDGSTAITLQADASGEGKITTQVLQITGGSDLSEQFDIRASNHALQPGMVVCIDPQNAGELIASSKAYDRTVAGVMSGAGGVKPGMLMGQQGTAADGKHPVALTGRVYCVADASNGSIHPGDLLTTSHKPGHAMKVTNYDKAHGAIIGKAMSSLEKGEGLVLVLVSLQ